MVIAADAHASLLDTYEGERKAHAQDLVDWAVAIGRLMEHMAAVELAAQTGESAPDMPLDLLASGYGQGREIPPLRSGVLIEDQVADDGITGNLYNQPVIRTAQGEVRLDELLGPGFAIVVNVDADLDHASAKIISQLGINIVNADELEIVGGTLTGKEHNAVIIRPDKYVFGHTDERHTVRPSVVVTCSKTPAKK